MQWSYMYDFVRATHMFFSYDVLTSKSLFKKQSAWLTIYVSIYSSNLFEYLSIMKLQTERGRQQVLQALGIPKKLKICLFEISSQSGIQSLFQNNIFRVFKIICTTILLFCYFFPIKHTVEIHINDLFPKPDLSIAYYSRLNQMRKFSINYLCLNRWPQISSSSLVSRI